MIFRMIFGLPGAAFVTGVLFVVMAWLVRQEAQPLPPIDPPKIDILAKLKPTQTKPKPAKPTVPVDPPPVDIDFPDPIDRPGPGVPIERIPGPTKTDGPVIDIITTRPTIRPHPAYPENCRARGAQGVVIVEFDLTPEGDVVNPRIVSSANSCLDRTVLNTIQKWKYAPKQDSSGRPVMQRGVREFFNFQLTEE
jgi:protein TonB